MQKQGCQLLIYCLNALTLCAMTANEKAIFRDDVQSRLVPTVITPGSFHELLDFRSLPQSKQWRTYQASGYDRDGGFYDSGNFLRIENANRYVLMDAKGPGCIDRMWFTYKKPIGTEPYDLLVYIDEQTQPLIDVDLDELFSGKYPPFVQPFSGVCGLPRHPGRFSYVPIGFERSCKVVLRPSAPLDEYTYRKNSTGQLIPHIYYQITFRKFNYGTIVKPFSWQMNIEEKFAFDRLKQLFESSGDSPWNYIQNLEKVSGSLQLRPGEQISLFSEKSSGVIYSIRIKLTDPQQVWLQMVWDNDAEPQVFTPFGPFFACNDRSTPETEVNGFWIGYAHDFYYSYLPMPYQKQARISLLSKNKLAKPQEISYEIYYRKESVTEEQNWFCASRYDYNPPLSGQPYEVLHLKGAGHLVGIVMDRPGNMEGDDRFFIDGEANPSIHGTGTEDFFNFAWGLSHTGAFPLHGITIQEGYPLAYRFHIPASIPFYTLIRITWEHGHDYKKGPNFNQEHYSGITIFYLYPNDSDK